jgi:hypothetical protein
MALEQKEIDAVFLVARAFVKKLQAGSAIADTSGDIPVIADFPGMPQGYTTTALIATAINRHFNEDAPHNQKTTFNRLGNIAET